MAPPYYSQRAALASPLSAYFVFVFCCCLTGLFFKLFHVKRGTPKQNFGVAGGIFTDQMPFLSPKQQCQSTEEKEKLYITWIQSYSNMFTRVLMLRNSTVFTCEQLTNNIHASFHHWRLCLSSGHFARLELSSVVHHVAAVTARVQATAQDCAVCPLLRLLKRHILFASRSRLLIC